jgi:lysophospholipase L1-like esterase
VLLLRLATAALATLLGLAVAEALARGVYAEDFLVLVDPYEGHPYRPGQELRQTWGQSVYTVCTNSLGWKDRCPGRQVALDASPRTRVVLLGDSFTEGIGFPEERTVSGFAGAALEDGFEVLNGGRVSYSPILELQRLKRFFAAGHRADVVVLLLDLSDVQDEVSYSSRYLFAADGEPLRFQGGPYGLFWRGLYNHSALARGLKRRIEREQEAEPGAGVLPASDSPLTARDLLALPAGAQALLRSCWMFHPPSLEGWVQEGFRSLAANVGRIQRLAGAHGARLLVVIYPWPHLLGTRDDPGRCRALRARSPERVQGKELASEYRRRIGELCRSRSLPLLDLTPDFQRAPRREELFLPGDVHFSEAGNRLAGERIAAAVRRLSSRR